MTRGPDQQRLLDYVTPGRQDHLLTAEDQWRKGASILSQMGTQLRAKARAIRESPDVEFSGATAATAAQAFEDTAGTMDTKSQDMHDGSAAFGKASTALLHATNASDHLEKHAPGAFPKDPGIAPGSSQPEDVAAQKQYDTAVTNYWQNYHANEQVARTVIADLQENHTEQAKVFQRIHGELPPSSHEGTSGNPVDNGTAPSTTHVPTGGQLVPTHPTVDSDDDNHPTTTTPTTPTTTTTTIPTTTTGTTVGPGIPQGPSHSQTTPLPAGPGLPGTVAGGGTVGGGAGAMGGVGAVAGGALGGAAAAGLAAGGLNGLAPMGGGVRGGLSAAGVRGIGATSRTGAGSVLGRGTSGSGRAGAGGMSSRSSGRNGGRNGGRSAGTRGARGQAGGRGAGAGAGSGRNGKDKKRQGEERDLFDDGNDWIDDEDVAPGLLD